MVFGTPKQDTPVGLLAKGNVKPSPTAVPMDSGISDDDVLETLPPIQTEVIKRAVSEVVQKYREAQPEKPALDYAAYREERETSKTRYSDVLLPAVNSAKSLATSAENVTPELLAAKLRYERTKAMQAKRPAEKPSPVERLLPIKKHLPLERAAAETQPAFQRKVVEPVAQPPVAIKPPSFREQKPVELNVPKKRKEKPLKRSERKIARKKASAIPDTWLNQDEKWYWWLAFGTSVLLYMGISTYLIWAFIYDDYPLLAAVGGAIVTYFCVTWYYQARNLGRLQQSSIHVSERQFSELYAESENIADKLGMNTLPRMFVAKSGENAEVRSLRMLGQDVLIIPSDIAALAYQNELPAISYLIAREFVKIKQKHGRLNWLTLPSRIVPFVGSGYAQKCVLSCDRAAAFCKPEGALSGLKLLAVGKTLYQKKAKETLVPVDEGQSTLLGNLLAACAYIPTFVMRFQLLVRVPSVQ